MTNREGQSGIKDGAEAESRSEKENMLVFITKSRE
jgi:hypothetical protein